MNSAEAEQLVAKGISALDHDHTHLALICFERAMDIERSGETCSYLAFCLATVRGEFERGIELCHEAIAQEPENPLHHRNLGRVLLLAGRKEDALQVLRQGMRLGWDEGIIRDLERLGTRNQPVLKKLHRNHPLNKWLGIILSRLGLR